jgi:hypothetical protein
LPSAFREFSYSLKLDQGGIQSTLDAFRLFTAEFRLPSNLASRSRTPGTQVCFVLPTPEFSLPHFLPLTILMDAC